MATYEVVEILLSHPPIEVLEHVYTGVCDPNAASDEDTWGVVEG